MATDADVVVLGLLAESPGHGYALDRVIGERGYRNWTSLAFSSVYSVLKRLSDGGLIEPAARSEGRRTVFQLTEAGERELRAAAVERISRPDRPSESALPALGAYEHLDDPALRRALRQRTDALDSRITWLRKAREATDVEHAQVIFDYELARLEADLGWTQGLLDRRTRSAPSRKARKVDLKKDRKDLYQPGWKEFTEVDVRPMAYLAIDGHGDPNTSPEYSAAVAALYTGAYAIKFALKARSGDDFVVGPLEGLWSSADPSVFVERKKAQWDWTMMIPLPEPVTGEDIAQGLVNASEKKPDLPIACLRARELHEGRSLQIMHVGSFDAEAATLARLHDEVMPARALTWNGPHHEIYLSDRRRVAPEKMRTVLRQPVKPAG